MKRTFLPVTLYPMYPSGSRQASFSRGFSLLESCIALGVTAVIILICATLVRNGAHATTLLLRQCNGRRAAEKSFAILEAAVRLSEHHRVPNGVTIYPSAPPLLASLPRTSRPRPESHVLSVINTSLPHRSAVLESTLSPARTSITLSACHRWEITSSAEIRSYLLIGLTDAVEITGSITPLQDGCFTLSGNAVNGGTTRSLATLGSPLEVLPIISTYTLFVDASGQLRLVSHIGSRILENQPLLTGLRSLEITRLISPEGAEGYEFAVRPSNSKTLYYSMITGITRRSLLHEALL